MQKLPKYPHHLENYVYFYINWFEIADLVTINVRQALLSVNNEWWREEITAFLTKVALPNLEINVMAPMTIRLLHKYGNALPWYLSLKHLGAGNKCIQNIHIFCIVIYFFYPAQSHYFW